MVRIIVKGGQFVVALMFLSSLPSCRCVEGMLFPFQPLFLPQSSQNTEDEVLKAAMAHCKVWQKSIVPSYSFFLPLLLLMTHN